MESARQLEQFLQVNDLVIAPVADVAPGIVGLFDFPVDAFFGNPIGVVAVHRGSVDEFRDDALDKLRVTEGECFPVLENIAPVAFVGKQLVAVIVPEFDGELIPWPTWISVAATEPDREVFVCEACQLRITVLLHFVE